MTNRYWIKKVPPIVKQKANELFPEREGFSIQYYKYKSRGNEWVFVPYVKKDGKLWDYSHQLTLEEWRNR